MSASSPDDLATVFRSIPRRLREAEGEAPSDEAAPSIADVRAHLQEAGRLLGTLADPTAIADAISATPPDQWDEATLDQLRGVALDIGRLLRHIAAISGHD